MLSFLTVILYESERTGASLLSLLSFCVVLVVRSSTVHYAIQENKEKRSQKNPHGIQSMLNFILAI